MELSEFTALSSQESGLVVVATARADGSIQSSLVNAGPIPHPVTGADVLAYVTYGRAKLTNVGPGDPLPGVADEDIPGLLRAIFVAAGGTHDDWDEFDAVMARERREAVLVTPTRLYSN